MSTVDPATASHPALWEMALIHRIFRRGFAELAATVGQVPAGDREWAKAVGGHVEFMLTGLSAHHETEDDLAWPVLLTRAEPSSVLIDRMQEQHRGLHTAISDVRTLTGAWVDEPAPEAASALSASLYDLLEHLQEHLDDEEADVVPLLAATFSIEEWEAVGRKGFEKFTPEQRFIAMGQMLEVATPAEAAAMTAKLPWPVMALWRVVGRRRYRRYLEAVRRDTSKASRT